MLDKTDACFELFTNLFYAWVSVGNVSFLVDFIGQCDVVSASLRRYDVACCFKVDGASSHVRLIFDGKCLGTIV